MQKRGTKQFTLVLFFLLLTSSFVSSTWLDEYRTFITTYTTFLTGKAVTPLTPETKTLSSSDLPAPATPPRTPDPDAEEEPLGTPPEDQQPADISEKQTPPFFSPQQDIKVLPPVLRLLSPSLCSLTSITWNQEEVILGEQAMLRLQTNGYCKSVTLELFDQDFLFDDFLLSYERSLPGNELVLAVDTSSFAPFFADFGEEDTLEVYAFATAITEARQAPLLGIPSRPVQAPSRIVERVTTELFGAVVLDDLLATQSVPLHQDATSPSGTGSSSPQMRIISDILLVRQPPPQPSLGPPQLAQARGNPACQFPGPFLPTGGTPLIESATGLPMSSYGGFDPHVLWNEQQQEFEMWFSNFIPAPQQHPPAGWTGFAYATSPDGVTWTILLNQSTGEPVHVLDASTGGWDGYNIETNAVVVNQQTGTYVLMYGGYPGLFPNGSVMPVTAEGRRIMLGMAQGPSGTSLTKPSPNPNMGFTYSWEQPYQVSGVENGTNYTIWQGGVLEPAILWNGTHYELWYQTQTEVGGKKDIWYIGYATSATATNWQKHPLPVLEQNDSIAWEQGGSGPGHTNVIYDPQYPLGRHLFYLNQGIGHAYSEDGKTWERNPKNPLIVPSVGLNATFFYGGPTAAWKDDVLYLWVMRWRLGTTIGQAGTTTFLLFTANCSLTTGQAAPQLNQLAPNITFNDINNTINLTGNNFDPLALVLVDNQTNNNFSEQVINTTFMHLDVLDNTPAAVYQIKVRNPDGQESAALPLTVLQGGGQAQNNPPALDPIGNQAVTENVLLQFFVNATDPDNNTLTYSATNLPPRARFVNQFFTWRPNLGEAGTYKNVEFIVTDNGRPPLSDSENITITVNVSLDDDGDSVPNNEDCNDNNPAIGECTGCALCSDPNGVNGICIGQSSQCGSLRCPPPLCNFGSCAANETALFNATEQQSCVVNNQSIGICQPQQCSPLSCQSQNTCLQDSDCDSVPDFMDKCPNTPPGCPSSGAKVNSYSGCRFPSMTKFNPNLSTNFSAVYNLLAVEDLQLGIDDRGIVAFWDPVPLLQYNPRLGYYEPLDLDNAIFISYNNVSIEPGNASGNASSNFTMFNQYTTIVLFDLPYTYPEVLIDGVPCTTCSIYSYINGELEFDVLGFSSYSARESPSGGGSGPGSGYGYGSGGPGLGGGYGASGTSVSLDLDVQDSYTFSAYRTVTIFITYDLNLYSIAVDDYRYKIRHIELYTYPNEELLTVAQGDQLDINIDALPDNDIEFIFEEDRGSRVELTINRIDKNIPSVHYPSNPSVATPPAQLQQPSTIQQPPPATEPAAEEKQSFLHSIRTPKGIAMSVIGAAIVVLVFIILRISRKKDVVEDV